MKPNIILGPVLSFRGLTSDGVWQVTALLGVSALQSVDGIALPPPVMLCRGEVCPEPTLLLSQGKQQYWRYDLSVVLQGQEQCIGFGIQEESFLQWHYTAPALEQAPRMAYVSCNGFSDPSGMRKLVRAANNVWADVLANHDHHLRPSNYALDKEQMWHEARTHNLGLQRFHLLLMGGDQIYFDSIWEDIPALKNWVAMSRDAQLRFTVSKALEQSISNYYLNLYAQRWLPSKRKPWGHGSDALADAADAMARIPTIMMWDDHDIFDGWGSYSPAMQQCQLFQVLFTHARRAFWVFQMQHSLDDLPDLRAVDSYNVNTTTARVRQNDPMLEPVSWPDCLKGDPLALPLLNRQAGFSSAYKFGSVALLVPDLRTERSRTQIMGASTWDAIQRWLFELTGAARIGSGLVSPKGCQHLLLMSSVPVVHPKLSLVEGLLDTFGQDHVLDSNADDIKDHWSHDDHEGERKRLIETLARVAQKGVQVTLLSGDVHVAAWGTITNRQSAPGTTYWPPIIQLTSSAVVHPSLKGIAERLFLSLLNKTAAQSQNLDAQYTLEMMLFPAHNQYVMPARNWLALELDTARTFDQPLQLWATWRCEGESGFSNHIQVVKPPTKIMQMP